MYGQPEAEAGTAAARQQLYLTAVVAGDADIGEACFVGTNATIRDRVRVGPRCVIGAGAVIMADCAADGVYPGPRSARRD